MGYAADGPFGAAAEPEAGGGAGDAPRAADRASGGDAASPSAAALPDGTYAVVELLGHRTLVGRIEEVEKFGAPLLQIEPLFDGRLMAPVWHTNGALYGVTPLSKEKAFERAPTAKYHLPAPLRARLDDEVRALPAPSGAGFEDELEDDFDEEMPI